MKLLSTYKGTDLKLALTSETPSFVQMERLSTCMRMTSGNSNYTKHLMSHLNQVVS